ncbi:MAG: hypothetical protein UY40_C0004G0004 [candidate division CPR1 bacterium GW2011_GWC1_49_13]|uniref:Uncharacterized protein n=1 Tax=candidate division CPR1 bacterium GW2011_GWC1_49_13 TaxID=1618342 RepID=A0A0G1VIG2_9BACT|nr:MAG: hypothetical protein UY40_C0004G0004 [candidate division CPR1 bacterium GW2011_GWC1_49_13]
MVATGFGPNCSGCMFFCTVEEHQKPNGVTIRQINEKAGDIWCGWAGGSPRPQTENYPVCNFQPRSIPHHLAAANSGLVVSRAQLADWNDIHREAVGTGDY